MVASPGRLLHSRVGKEHAHLGLVRVFVAVVGVHLTRSRPEAETLASELVNDTGNHADEVTVVNDAFKLDTACTVECVL